MVRFKFLKREKVTFPPGISRLASLLAPASLCSNLTVPYSNFQLQFHILPLHNQHHLNKKDSQLVRPLIKFNALQRPSQLLTKLCRIRMTSKDQSKRENSTTEGGKSCYFVTRTLFLIPCTKLVANETVQPAQRMFHGGIFEYHKYKIRNGRTQHLQTKIFIVFSENFVSLLSYGIKPGVNKHSISIFLFFFSQKGEIQSRALGCRKPYLLLKSSPLSRLLNFDTQKYRFVKLL